MSLREAAALAVIESSCSAASRELQRLIEDEEQAQGPHARRMWVFGSEGGLLVRPVKVSARDV